MVNIHSCAANDALRDRDAWPPTDFPAIVSQEARKALKAAQAELVSVRAEAARAGDRAASAAQLEAVEAEAAALRAELQEVRDTAYGRISDAKQARRAHASPRGRPSPSHRFAVALGTLMSRLPATRPALPRLSAAVRRESTVH